MARKPAATTDEITTSMDYAQHEATWKGFVTLLKWSILSLALIVLALYSFIEAKNAILGVVLLLLIPILAVGGAVMGTRRAA